MDIPITNTGQLLINVNPAKIVDLSYCISLIIFLGIPGTHTRFQAWSLVQFEKVGTVLT